MNDIFYTNNYIITTFATESETRVLTKKQKQMKQTKRLFLSFLTLLLATMTYAQEVTGTVSDSFGPVIGATVMEKGTTNGTVTDFDGNFKLKVKAGTTLVFS